MSVFSERLKSTMKRQSVTQAQLSALTGIPKSAISQYLSEKFKPRQERVYIISRALNVNPAWLSGYDNAKSDYDSTKKLTLSSREYSIICAYRTSPDFKKQLDAILPTDETEHNTFDIFRAANSLDGKTPPSSEEISAERLRRLSNAPQTDEEL